LPLVALLAALVALLTLFIGAVPVSALYDGSGVCSITNTLGCWDDLDCPAGETCLMPEYGGETIHWDENIWGCMNDVYNQFGQGGNLNCTAEDIKIYAIHDLEILDPCESSEDTAVVTFVAEFELTAEARYDVGVYIAADAGDALTGDCSITTFPGAPEPMWVDLDNPTGPVVDMCGDVDGDHARIFHQIDGITVGCEDEDVDGFSDVSACLSWRQPGNNDECDSPYDAYPGTPAKCKCQILPGIPTSVELSSFTATAEDHSILVEWQTATETDNLGFNLYRALASDGAKTQLNGALIPSAQPPGSPIGASYSWPDSDVAAGTTYYYWLEDVDLAGVAMLHGPVTATIEPASVDDPGQQPPGDAPPAPDPETPFVPEASTFLLLGSAASGLAGYVGLQIRARRRK
jgi:hypothetical protein